MGSNVAFGVFHLQGSRGAGHLEQCAIHQRKEAAVERARFALQEIVQVTYPLRFAQLRSSSEPRQVVCVSVCETNAGEFLCGRKKVKQKGAAVINTDKRQHHVGPRGGRVCV